jgi:hypothetical protein
MKEVVKRETLRVMAEQKGRKLRKFQRELDDDPELSRSAMGKIRGPAERCGGRRDGGDGAVLTCPHGWGL